MVLPATTCLGLKPGGGLSGTLLVWEEQGHLVSCLLGQGGWDDGAAVLDSPASTLKATDHGVPRPGQRLLGGGVAERRGGLTLDGQGQLASSRPPPPPATSVGLVLPTLA